MYLSTLLVLIPSLTIASGHVILARGGDGYEGGNNNGGYGGQEFCKADGCYQAVYNEHATSFRSKYIATKSCDLPQYLLGYNTESVNSACSCYIHPGTSASSSPVKTTSDHTQTTITTSSKGQSSPVIIISTQPSETTKAPSVNISASTASPQSISSASTKSSASTNPSQSAPTSSSSQPASTSKPSQSTVQSPSSTKPASTSTPSQSSAQSPPSSQPAPTSTSSQSSAQPPSSSEPPSTSKPSQSSVHSPSSTNPVSTQKKSTSSIAPTTSTVYHPSSPTAPIPPAKKGW